MGQGGGPWWRVRGPPPLSPNSDYRTLPAAPTSTPRAPPSPTLYPRAGGGPRLRPPGERSSAWRARPHGQLRPRLFRRPASDVNRRGPPLPSPLDARPPTLDERGAGRHQAAAMRYPRPRSRRQRGPVPPACAPLACAGAPRRAGARPPVGSKGRATRAPAASSPSPAGPPLLALRAIGGASARPPGRSLAELAAGPRRARAASVRGAIAPAARGQLPRSVAVAASSHGQLPATAIANGEGDREGEGGRPPRGRASAREGAPPWSGAPQMGPRRSGGPNRARAPAAADGAEFYQ